MMSRKRCVWLVNQILANKVAPPKSIVFEPRGGAYLSRRADLRDLSVFDEHRGGREGHCPSADREGVRLRSAAPRRQYSP